MRYNALTLVVVALLAVGASGGVAASTNPSTAGTTPADVPAANHTVDIVNPDEISDEEVDRAIETAWANDEVQSYFDDDAAVHFDIWASELDERVVHVNIAPADAPDSTRVIADVDIERGTVTSIDEPVRLNASNAMTINTSGDTSVSIDGAEYELHGNDTTSDGDATRYPAHQATHFQLNESSIERGGDGAFTFELEDDDGTVTDVSIGDIFRIDFPSAEE
ncbi:hypothetical protein [Haloglomus salinum]|jgi:hypothetical protein|uniref:hypothetical protein n=1 Tax=Haloglomus salinum TaxID=2962673 RepID=UPI0020C9D63B|nr:hypothetical protein [Haloglomus salinum]